VKFGDEGENGVPIPRRSYSHPFRLIAKAGMYTRTMIRPARYHRWSLPCLGLCMMLVGMGFCLRPVMADDPKPAPPAPAPVTPPQPAKPPATTPVIPVAPPAPKAVALAFAAALEKGDAATAKSLLAPDETGNRGQWVDATIALSAALRKLDAAAVAKFGESTKSISQDQLHLGASLKSIEQAQEKIDGDAATLTLPGQPHPLLRLRKVDGGQWRLEAGPAPETAREQLALYARLLKAATKTTDEIAVGDYASAESAARVFAARVLDARLKT